MKKRWIITVSIIIIGLIIILIFLNNQNRKKLDICAEHGDLINEPAGTNKELPDKCCEGLVGLASFSISDMAECQILKGGPFLTCMPCGNGVCDEGENGCNCPQDCECAEKGELAEPANLKGETPEPDTCCNGLRGVGGYYINDEGECEIVIGTPYVTCVPCGDGICEEIGPWFENKCNCPEDCP